LIDEYTTAIVVGFNIEEPSLTDPINKFEYECIHSFSISFVEDDDFDVNGDFDKDDFSPTKEKRPCSANAFDYSFDVVNQSN